MRHLDTAIDRANSGLAARASPLRNDAASALASAPPPPSGLAARMAAGESYFTVVHTAPDLVPRPRPGGRRRSLDSVPPASFDHLIPTTQGLGPVAAEQRRGRRRASVPGAAGELDTAFGLDFSRRRNDPDVMDEEGRSALVSEVLSRGLNFTPHSPR